MNTVKTKGGKTIRIVSSSEKDSVISSRDAEMDARATEAVRAAIEKAMFCKKPVAKYDSATKQAYIEYADGVKKYVE